MKAEERMLEVLGTGGHAALGLEAARLRELYRLMRRVRALDVEAMNLQRQGELTAYAPLAGQEAAQVGSAYALEPGDFAFPSYRELGVAVTRGADVAAYLLAYRGIWHGGMHDPLAARMAPNASPVGSHLLHAVGWAMGRRLDRAADCAIVYFGDGATSEGDALEAFNFAGVFRAPVVFLCQNNQWAISVPLEKQTAAPIWRKAEAFGFPGVRVDGNDVLAVYQATREALARARADGTPTLVEALTYRVGPHSTADDPSRYRHQDEVERWRRRDPIDRYRKFLEAEKVAGEDFFAEVETEVREELAGVRAAVTAAEARPLEEIFEFMFAELTPDLARQLETARQLQRLSSEDG
jgi:2-oxoisovalerate dehydrogenase E1 component alpha subunit